MFDDESRGYMIELLLTKFKYIMDYQPSTKVPQLVCMSASISCKSLRIFARWLKANLYDATERGHKRPIQHYEMTVNKASIDLHTSPESDSTWSKPTLPPQAMLNKLFLQKKDTSLLYLALEAVVEGHSSLVFCHTKEKCEKISNELSQSIQRFVDGQITDIKKQSQLQLVDKMKEVLSRVVNNEKLSKWREKLKSVSSEDGQLYKNSQYGVAFHNGNLTFDERAILEDAFRDKAIRILCCTTTLSSGEYLNPLSKIVQTFTFHYFSF